MASHDTPGSGFSFRYQSATSFSSTALVPLPIINVVNAPRFFKGYIYGFKQPVACITIGMSAVTREQCIPLQTALAHYYSPYAFSKKILENNMDVLHSLAQAASDLQKAGGMPIFDNVKVEPINQELVDLWVPMLFDHCVHDVLQYLLRVYNFHIQENRPIQAAFNKQQEILLQTLKTHAPQGTNTLFFLQAAHENHIPWTHVALNNFQYGYGKNSRWFDSSFTDLTPHTTAALANNKRAMNYFLAKQGIPVVEQYVVTSEQEAIKQANTIGYPIVLKPIDGHGGKGVMTHIEHDIAVHQAYRATKELTPTVLLEKHIHGKDYRLIVLRGKLIWAIERIPAGVHGDGVNTIAKLVEINNQDHRAVFPLRHIKITAETIQFLEEQGLAVTRVIEKDRFVPLHRIANISAGGTPIAVFNQVHPDNVKLMEAVATLLRLDIAGIDFITSDISQSYREVGGSIIEVNLQPQLGRITTSHIYADILNNLLPVKGHIPIYVIYADEISPELLLKITSQLPSDATISMAISNTIYLNNQFLLQTKNIYMAGQHSLLRHDVTALIYCICDEKEVLEFGLPFASCTQLFAEQGKLEKNMLVKHTLLKACREHDPLISPYPISKSN